MGKTHWYLLCGTKKALLIDTGLGVSNIKEVVAVYCRVATEEQANL